jgi:hypothetical protein
MTQYGKEDVAPRQTRITCKKFKNCANWGSISQLPTAIEFLGVKINIIKSLLAEDYSMDIGRLGWKAGLKMDGSKIGGNMRSPYENHPNLS